MKQFNLTEENDSITRADIAALLNEVPEGDDRIGAMRDILEQLDIFTPVEIDKVLADIDSY